MTMRKRINKQIKKFLVPHAENDFRPHLLRLGGMLAFSLVLIGIFVVSDIYKKSLEQSDYMASILPSVLIDLANADRDSASLQTLTLNSQLQDAAELKAEDMVAKSYFAHYSPDGLSPWYWMKKAGYAFVYAGENLAINFDESDTVNTAWMNSPGHRANLLNEHFTEIGIAAEKGIYQGRDTIFVVQMFGSPADTSVKALANTQSSTSTATSTYSARASTELSRMSSPQAGSGSPAAPTVASASTTQSRPPQVLAPQNLVPIATSQVLGQNSNDIFISVQDASATPLSLAAATESKTNYSNFISRVMLNPTRMVGIIYAILALMLLFSLFMVVRVRHMHQFKHSAYIFLLLGLMVILFTFFYYLASNGIQVLVV